MAKIKRHSMYAKFGDLAHRQIGGRKVPGGIADAPTILEVGGSRPLADMDQIDLPENVSVELGKAPKIRLRPGEDEATIRVSMQDMEPVEDASLQIDQERLAGEALRVSLFAAARRRALSIAKVQGPRFRPLSIGFIDGREGGHPCPFGPDGRSRKDRCPGAQSRPQSCHSHADACRPGPDEETEENLMSGSPKVGAGGPALSNNRGTPGVNAEVSSLKARGAVDQFQRGGSGREAAAHWGAAMRGVNQEAAGRMQLEDLQRLQNGGPAQRAEHLRTLGAEQRLAEEYICQYRQQSVERRNSGNPMSSSEELAEQRHREMVVTRYQDIKEALSLYSGGQPSRPANDQPRSINQGRQDQSGTGMRRDQPERDAFRRDDMGTPRDQEHRRGEPEQRRQQDMERDRQDPRMGQQDPRRDNDPQRSQDPRRGTSNVVRPAEFNPHIPDDLRRLEAGPQTRVDIHQYEYSLQTGMAHSSPEERHQQRQEKLTSLRDTAKEIERIANDPRHANKLDQMVDHADRLGVIDKDHAQYGSTAEMARHMKDLAERYDRQGKVEQACWNYEQSRETIGRKPSNLVSRDEWEDYVGNRNRAAGELLKWHRDRERRPDLYSKIDLEQDRAEEIQAALHQAHERGRRMAVQKQQSSRNLLQAYRARREAGRPPAANNGLQPAHRTPGADRSRRSAFPGSREGGSAANFSPRPSRVVGKCKTKTCAGGFRKIREKGRFT
ncbi:hypothetical protein [Azospirillum brasilense]|uniref:Uncharacterized protein n=1 Tax=Azospirillum brasilense TaxID=192 RepID=A0A6L3AVE2_AZOBR|nr:hypothetical protein [Azospirillum brasilense]KAA0678201.1 hypothetical protein DS837_28195 [Azospirillum brasilense]